MVVKAYKSSKRFPKSQNMVEKWIQNIHREDFKRQNVTQKSRVCSWHFHKNDFAIRGPDQRNKLKEDAVPTAFEDYPAHLQPKNTRKRSHKSIIKREVDQISPSKKGKMVKNEHAYFKTHSAEDKTKLLKSKICTLKQQLRRKSANIKSMKGLIKQLRDQHKITDNVSRVLEHEVSGLPVELIRNVSKNQKLKSKGKRYSDATNALLLLFIIILPRLMNIHAKYYICHMCLP